MLRLATLDDASKISDLMHRSILEIFPRFYNEQQTASAAVYVGSLDIMLIEDGTYFTHEADGEIVACGGWSRRNRLYAGAGHDADDGRLIDPRSEPARVRAMFVHPDWTRRGLGRAILVACEDAARSEGFRSLALLATLPGVPLYEAFGFHAVERVVVAMPDGVTADAVAMEKPIAQR